MNASAAEAVKLMTETNVGALVVSDQKDPVGIFTEKDFVTKVLKNCSFLFFKRIPVSLPFGLQIAAKGLKASDVQMKDVMTSDIFTGSPKMSLFDAMSLLGDHGIRHLPIAEFVGSADDNDTRIVDIVSARDFFSWIKNF